MIHIMTGKYRLWGLVFSLNASRLEPIGASAVEAARSEA